MSKGRLSTFDGLTTKSKGRLSLTSHMPINRRFSTGEISRLSVTDDSRRNTHLTDASDAHPGSTLTFADLTQVSLSGNSMTDQLAVPLAEPPESMSTVADHTQALAATSQPDPVATGAKPKYGSQQILALAAQV